jgi:hypothetical protein
MIMKVVFQNGAWFIGHRGLKELWDETHGCHHFTVLDGSSSFDAVICQEIAVPISQVYFFILNYRRSGK